MGKTDSEVPGTSPKKKRNPQMRDYYAGRAEEYGLGRKSGKTWERLLAVGRKIKALRENGHLKEAKVIEEALDVSIRGTYEIAKLSDEVLFSLCGVVIAGEAPNLIEANKLVDSIIRRNQGINEKEVKLLYAKNGMYRLVSGHNKSSVLLSAQDLIDLSELLLSILPNLQVQIAQEQE